MKEKLFLSEKTKVVQYSAIREAFAAGRKPGVINATIGAPDFDVPEEIRTYAERAIGGGYNGYTETKGVVALREAFSKHLADTRHVERTPDEILVTAGTTMGIYLTLLCLLDEGDEVVIFEPYFPAYTAIVSLLGGTPILVPSDATLQPNIQELERRITKKTKVIIVNSPNNPTGSVYSTERIRDIVRVAKKYDAFILSDEVYRELVYAGEVFSPASICEKTILIDGLSKSKGATGWRIGFVAGPRELINAVEKMQQFTSVCAPSVLQHAAIPALSLPMSSSIVARYRKARDILLEGIDVNRPAGTFYVFIKMPVSGKKATLDLFARGLAVVPGHVFGPSYKNYIRVSYAMPLAQVEKMATILREYIQSKKSSTRLCTAGYQVDNKTS